MTQLGLSFAAGSQPVETSEDAADALTGEVLTVRRMKVLRLIAAHADGLTADEVVALLGGRHNTWAPRVTELLQVGLLDRLDGKEGRAKVRRQTRDGGSAFVHTINRRGLRHLEGGESVRTLEQRRAVCAEHQPLRVPSCAVVSGRALTGTRGERPMRQPLYYPGMNDALDRLEGMDETALLGVLDSLYGRDALKYGDGRAEILEEARQQVRRDFTNMHPEAVADREYIEAVARAARRNAGFA